MKTNVLLAYTQNHTDLTLDKCNCIVKIINTKTNYNWSGFFFKLIRAAAPSFGL